ncbi:hypothetical protein M5C72_06770 [Companilactobacillus allii]|uniref:SAM-dependent methyltransferase n=1 Tax=Companilactobacillus allii TaxID=1847728 RepID=A0A1P8Q4L4_9LACO|nr:hypothetical protein [Companilactobacillus allii]APX72801.1 hypothetical protein BTM29_09670 [Companilactobacillus allii]USQ67590.1 hypothetical protein M5C72_06770 [Companilactobacillus allii]
MTYIENLRSDADKLPNGKVFSARINFMEHICEALSNNELPKYHFPQFQFTKKEITYYMEHNISLDEIEFQSMSADLNNFDHDLGEFRTYLQTRFGYWATITKDFMKVWSDSFGDAKYLEVMAGNGYISKELQELGKTSICTDNKSWAKQSKTGHDSLIDVERLDALSAIDKYHDQVDYVILAWSPDRDEVDCDILKKIREYGLMLIVIGEKYGATNSKKFWDNAEFVDYEAIDELNKIYSRYDLVHDEVYLVK